jgi:radical SAM/Cys-rich protein
MADFAIEFSSLLTLANLPVSRFKGDLQRCGKLDEYMGLLSAEFNPATVDYLMCKNTINVGWDGAIYDCDFNQMLEMPIKRNGNAITLSDLPEIIAEHGRPIRIADHCLGCTAGAGSSCGGALS